MDIALAVRRTREKNGAMNRELSAAFARFAILAVVAAVWGCVTVTTSADLRMSDIAEDDAVIAGRLIIIYNGREYTENCSASFGESVLNLSPDGIVLFRVKKGWTSLQALSCKDTSLQHVRLKGAHFLARGDGWVTDFGDIVVTWHAPGGFKVAQALGLVGALIDASFDDGVASVEVKPPVAKVRDVFRHQTGSDGRWVIQLLSQPRNPIALAPAGASEPEAAGPAHRGFFCTTSPTGRASLSFCERSQPACERVRKVLSGQGLAECRPAETAWCVAADGKLRCFESEFACESRFKMAPEVSDLCGEQY